MKMDDRGQGLINVFLWFAGVLVALYVFYVIVTGALEPLYQFVNSMQVVNDQGYGGTVSNLWAILTIWAPLLFAVAAILLMIIFSVWREQFLGRGRVRGP